MLQEHRTTFMEPRQLIELLSGYSDLLKYRKGQYIFNEDSSPIGMYFVITGKVKLSRAGSDGKEQITRIAIPKEMLSITELFAGTRHTCSARTLEESTLMFIPKHELFALVHQKQELNEMFLRLLSMNLQQAEEKITAMAYKPVRGRLADALVVLSDKFNSDIASPHSLYLTRSDLASFVGTAKETVNRLISEFRKDNLVKTDGTIIHILNRPGLKRLSEMYD